MRGRNGQAQILASGEVHKLSEQKLPNGEYPLRVHVDLQGREPPVQRRAAQRAAREWKSAWRTINPSGACDVTATVDVDAERNRDETHIVLDPRPESTIRLVVMRSPQPKHLDPGGPVELRMDNVHGRFVFDNGVVTMNDVGVQFGGAPVRCNHGKVVVRNTGQFDLEVNDLWIKGLRLDSELRKKMPPLMAQFAQRLDDGRPFTARGDLKIGWSGVAGEPAWCALGHRPRGPERQQGQHGHPARAHPGGAHAGQGAGPTAWACRSRGSSTWRAWRSWGSRSPRSSRRSG